MSNLGNPLIISHNGTCCIYRSDLKILESDAEWLNDTCINFQMIRLSERTAAATALPAVVTAVVEDGGGGEIRCRVAGTDLNGNGVNTDDDDDEDKDEDENKDEDRIRVVFMDPCIVSFFMHQISVDDEEDRDEILGLYRNTWGLDPTVRTKKRRRESERTVAMMLPINDNHAESRHSFQTPGSGNHWSLLLVLINTSDLHTPTRRQRSNLARYFHLDSSRRCNSSAARTVATRVEGILSIGAAETTVAAHDAGGESDRDRNRESPPPTVGRGLSQHRTSPKRMATAASVVECSTPQQSNGHDCGLCTLANAEALAGGIGGLVGTEEEYDDREVKKWVERTVKEFTTGFGGMGKMTRSIRRRIAADVGRLKGSSG